jgi:hypothetical protein
MQRAHALSARFVLRARFGFPMMLAFWLTRLSKKLVT